MADENDRDPNPAPTRAEIVKAKESISPDPTASDKPEHEVLNAQGNTSNNADNTGDEGEE